MKPIVLQIMAIFALLIPAPSPATAGDLPRFASIRASEANARRGPGTDRRIDWTYQRRGLPVKIVAEHDNWRKIEDHMGEGGWMHVGMLSSMRTGIVVSAEVALLRKEASLNADIRARLEPGVIGTIEECRPDWCRIIATTYEGWVEKSALWGVGADEVIE